MRLIDADELIKNYLEHCRTEFEIKNCCMANENVIAIIDNAPTVERPQGEWIKYIRCIECSVCKNKFFADDEDENCQDYEPCTDLRFNFCPNCGADMRKETENEN